MIAVECEEGLYTSVGSTESVFVYSMRIDDAEEIMSSILLCGFYRADTEAEFWDPSRELEKQGIHYIEIDKHEHTWEFRTTFKTWKYITRPFNIELRHNLD